MNKIDWFYTHLLVDSSIRYIYIYISLNLYNLISIIILYIPPFLFYIYNRAAAPADDLSDELKICRGQLISKEAGWQHKLCDGNEEDYHVGGHVIELERCPHTGCGSRFHMNPLKNIAHQDIVHRCVILYLCGVCRGVM